MKELGAAGFLEPRPEAVALFVREHEAALDKTQARCLRGSVTRLQSSGVPKCYWLSSPLRAHSASSFSRCALNTPPFLNQPASPSYLREPPLSAPDLLVNFVHPRQPSVYPDADPRRVPLLTLPPVPKAR